MRSFGARLAANGETMQPDDYRTDRLRRSGSAKLPFGIYKRVWLRIFGKSLEKNLASCLALMAPWQWKRET
jgi:hypothetical protein